MNDIKINKEIREFETEAAYGITWRQLVWVIVGVALGVITNLLVSPYVSKDMAAYVCMLPAVPCVLSGFIRRNGMPFWKYIIYWCRLKIMPAKLIYRPIVAQQSKLRPPKNQKKGQKHEEEQGADPADSDIRAANDPGQETV